MNDVFFEKGILTSTEANYLCAMAQESIREITEKLNNLSFYKTEIAAIGSSNLQLTSLGIDSLDFIESDIDKIADMNSLTAWLKEAIKEKEARLNRVLNLSLEDFISEQNLTFPEEVVRPPMWTVTSELDIINTWDINKRNKYFRLEAKASTYGKFIHISRPFSKARKDLQQIITTPILREGTGRDTILVYRTPTVLANDVEATFFALEAKYRSYEKELNRMKAEIKEAVNNSDLKKAENYQLELDKFREKYENYNSRIKELRNMCHEWKITEKERISRLKIAIPKELQNIYQEVCKLS